MMIKHLAYKLLASRAPAGTRAPIREREYGQMGHATSVRTHPTRLKTVNSRAHTNISLGIINPIIRVANAMPQSSAFYTPETIEFVALSRLPSSKTSENLPKAMPRGVAITTVSLKLPIIQRITR